jgi:hypothetical protein
MRAVKNMRGEQCTVRAVAIVGEAVRVSEGVRQNDLCVSKPHNRPHLAIGL